MYFQIENTPEHVRRARRIENVPQESPKEECPRLILAPFSRPPQVVFDNVLLGSSCERNLEVLNPSKQIQQITLGKTLPPGLMIHLPEEWLELEPETCYILKMTWTPMQPTAMRETIRFTNENRGKYDVVVVLKSAMNIKGKNNQPKGFKISPGKMKKKVVTKKSPVSIYKKKAEVIYNTKTKLKKTVIQSTQHKVYQTFNKENISNNDYSINSYHNKCPFDSPSSLDLNFNTSEIFSNVKKTHVLQDTYDKSYNTTDKFDIPQNILRPLNKQNCEKTATDIFDNLSFTPLKAAAATINKLDKGPRIILSVNSDSDFDDSQDMKTSNKENETHSILSVSSSQLPNKWSTVTYSDNQYIESLTIPNKKHPDTSSPKENNSPNFSINTDFSRISELSFFPQRFSTERKCFPKINETHELLDDKLSSDTYTKDSPKTPIDPISYHTEMEKPPHYFNRDPPKMCRQSLFREYQMQREALDRNYLNVDHNVWQKDLRIDTRSPPRSITPPLQSIPEESIQFSDTQVFSRTDKQTDTFTIDRTFDKTHERSSASTRQTWSKKAIRVEQDLWKVPIAYEKKSLKPKTVAKPKLSIASKGSNVTFESNKSINQNVTFNQFGNIYSQSSTVDPFLSSTYFYNEEAVHKIENEFKRWLNCILTPPADLESNVEQKIDVGKAWIENRNKDVPLAPTKEQVSSAYHNSHRLESLRRAAKNMLLSPEMTVIFQKLNAQIEKKLIAIRTDKNLHLDVGLQKIIMEILLSYNPLWLRIGLEAIYSLVLPLKSNSDIEGLTTFIIQRMFKNPLLKNKHSKSNAPNMLLPAYIEAIKKYTLKKFFMLVYFLDQAKQRKLISHDPCLFCRNAICKESRDIIIRFTRELIAGIGDITKHLRPLGYVVCHKQSYLDEYKYAVHNLALDIRDGVRLTKVMEIIVMKKGLLNQLRTPAISRLQKIHNVQVAMNALKEANFVIVGEITATDIADGHREKTLSLLWQIIHVFRAPLFEKAANVIQTWWKKKYEVIVEKRKEEERVRYRLTNAASAIQHWWRKIQYNRQVEWRMHQITKATIVVQKYCRMWLCRTRLLRFKSNVLKIEEWYRSVKLIREAKNTLTELRVKREQLRHKCASIIQSHVKRWLCVKQYKITIQNIVRIQSCVRRFLIRRQYIELKKSVTYIQQVYRGKLLMRQEMLKFDRQRKSAIVIQSNFRMRKQRSAFLSLKKSVQILESRYIAILKMRIDRKNYLELKKAVTAIQAMIRRNRCRAFFMKQRNSIILIQRRVRAYQLMKKEKADYLKVRTATIKLQTYVRSYLTMKKARETYIVKRKSAVLIQRYYRSYLLTKTQRKKYIQLRKSSVIVQKHYRSLCLMRRQRKTYLELRNATLCIQRQYRAQVEMKKCRQNYTRLQTATLTIQHRYRALIKMREQRSAFLNLKKSVQILESRYIAILKMRSERKNYLELKKTVTAIQAMIRRNRCRAFFMKQRNSVILIQRRVRAYQLMKKEKADYLKVRTATIKLQTYVRSYLTMKKLRDTYITQRKSAVLIQRYYRSYLLTKTQRKEYIQLRKSSVIVQKHYINLCLMRKQRKAYLELRNATLCIQRQYRAQVEMKKCRQNYTRLQTATLTIQLRYRALIKTREQRTFYLKLRSTCTKIQRAYRARVVGTQQRKSYLKLKDAILKIQNWYRNCKKGKQIKQQYQQSKQACLVIQSYYKAYMTGRKIRQEYIRVKSATICIQRFFRSYIEMKTIRQEYVRIRTSTVKIQRFYRSHLEIKKYRNAYLKMMSDRRNDAASKIQTWYRSLRKRDSCRREFLLIRKHVITVQSKVRMYLIRKRFVETRTAAITIQWYYRSYKLAATERLKYIQVRNSIITLQSYIRSYIARKRYLRLLAAVTTIQAAYKLKKQRDLIRIRRENAAIIIQKHVRRYIIQSWYRRYSRSVLYVQEIWRGKLLTRLLHCGYLQKRRVIIKVQSAARGYLVRKHVLIKKEHILKTKEELRQNWAASKIQALFRGNKVRTSTQDTRVEEIRRRLHGPRESTEQTLKERNEEAMEVLRNFRGMTDVIGAFRFLEFHTEVFPMTYTENASSVVRRVYLYLSCTNRSVPCIEVLKSGAAILVNLARYKVTGPKIYARDRIAPILKFMLRFSNSQPHLFCILSTYLWIWSKYDEIKEDLREYLHIPNNHKMLMTIKSNVGRSKRLTNNARYNFHTPQQSKRISHTGHSMNMSTCSSNSNTSIVLPSLEPDFGITRIDKPKYFEDPEQAIACLFHVYHL